MTLAAAFVLAHAEIARATTTIGPTTYSSNTTWTSAGSPYWVTGSVSVTSGATLTVQPGVIVKFSSGTVALTFSGGKLNATGTAADPIVFTSIADDSVGGDTGGDGATSGTAGQWCNLAFTNSGIFTAQTSTLSHVTVRYAGKTSCGGATINAQTTTGNPGPILNLSDSTVTSGAGIGILLNGSTLTIQDSSVDHNASDGIKVSGTNGSAAISHTAISSNTGKGLTVWSLTTGSPATSVFDSTITGNGIGVHTLLSASLPADSWPFGHRNNIYANGGDSPDTNQMFDSNTSPRGNWTNNFWGSDVHFRYNAAECGLPIGYVAYDAAVYPNQLSPFTHGPQWAVYHPPPAGPTICFQDRTFIGPSEFSTVPFGSAP